MKHVGDITNLSGHTLPPVDCITGGSPCQDLSVAGLRKGLEGERSGLFMEQIRIVKEMREHDRGNGRTDDICRPRYMVWENVPGAFSSNGGKDFQTVLTEIVRIAEPSAPDVPLPEGGRWSKAGCLYGMDGRWSIAWRVHDAQFWGVPQRRKRIALVADFGGMSAPEILFERTGLLWNPSEGGKERKGTAGGSEDSTGKAISFQERAGKPGGGKGILIQDEHVGALSTLNNQSVFSSTKNTVVEDGISPTLTARMGTGGNQVNAICMDVGFFQTEEEKAGALLARQYKDPPITYQDKTCALMASRYQKNGTQEAANDMYVTDNLVRRLTPKECERLQAFPDDWTNIGEWTDSKGKKHKDADSPRYKALGNSIALPFWFWLLRRISAQYERQATLGSLFDGIGGFPYCWEKCNGKGSAIWASEIEEFPIAVTKLRFPEREENE